MEEKLAKRITSSKALAVIEKNYRRHAENETNVLAKNASFVELAEVSMPDKNGAWSHPLSFYISHHASTIGIADVCKEANSFLEKHGANEPLDILSVTAGIKDSSIELIVLVRFYALPFKHSDLCDAINKKAARRSDIPNKEKESCKPIVTQEDILLHQQKLKAQADVLVASTEDTPFLNGLDAYTRRDISQEDMNEQFYDLRTRDMQIQIMSSYDDFITVFRECMQFITSVTERENYYDVMRGRSRQDVFMKQIESYIHRRFISKKQLPLEDLPALLKKIEYALFRLYIVQDLIDDPNITDVIITAHNSIRVRVNGRGFLSNVTFVDEQDYERFITGLAVKNNIDLKVPTQTFTDDHDAGYILRFTITAPYITSSNIPIMHIRKAARKKLLGEDLIKAGMMNEKVRDYLLDCGKYSRGIVFAGPPGSGKTVALNWFLEEAYEASAEILVIQENDELFSSRNGVMFEHVVMNPQKGEQRTTLEDLGQMALVAGANVFVIGEAKGAEICSAITLSNSGCRTAITIHSNSSTETIDKMADLAMRGYATSFEQAKRMMKSFETIVYLRDFKIQEITQITGYNEETKDMFYRPIYRR